MTPPTSTPNNWPFPTWRGQPRPLSPTMAQPLRLEPAKRAPRPAPGHVTTQPMEAPY